MAEPTKLDYYSEPLEKGQYRISPSSISKFLNNSESWYREHILKEKSFNGNTATVLGTCVHFMAECFIKDEPIDHDEIEKYIKKHFLNPDVDQNTVRDEYPDMGNILLDYLAKDKPDRSEEYIKYEMEPNFFVAGSCDAVNKDILIDFKTANSKPSAMKEDHFLQAMIYAFIYRQLGVRINSIRIVYITRKTKTLPPRIFDFTIDISKGDFDRIESLLQVAIDSLKLSIEKPELTRLLFRPNPTTYY